MANTEEIGSQLSDAWAVAIPQPDGSIRLACGENSEVATFIHRQSAVAFRDALQVDFDRYDEKSGLIRRKLIVLPIEVVITAYRSKASRKRSQTTRWGKPIRG